MKFLTLMGILVALFLHSKSQNVSPLKVGNTTPDLEFKRLINHKKTSVKLSDLKDKLVILEFWATWCNTCLAKFPESESIQKKYAEKVQIFLVNGRSTGDDLKTIHQFLDRRKKLGKALTLPIVPEEDIANNLFQHFSLPHYAWIKNQQVVAITGSREMNENNIEAALKGDYSLIRTKADLNKRYLYFLDTLAPANQIASYSIVFKGLVYPLNNGGGTFTVRMKDKIPQGVAFGNHSLIQIYQRIAASLIPDSHYDPAYVKVNSNNTALKETWEIPKEEQHEWRLKNAISLEVNMPGRSLTSIYERVLGELNLSTDYIGEVKPVVTKCLVLHYRDSLLPIGMPANTATQSTPYQGSNLAALKSAIFALRPSAMPLVDNTGANLNLSIWKTTDWSNWNQLLETLANNNLLLKEMRLTIPMLVVSPKEKP